jgi:hypothetical protein
VPLSQDIQRAVAQVGGVTEQDMEIMGYLQAEEFTALLKQALGERG